MQRPHCGPTNVRKHCPVNASHSRIDLSLLPVATKQPGVLARSSPTLTCVRMVSSCHHRECSKRTVSPVSSRIAA
jgi:hypothetical protein